MWFAIACEGFMGSAGPWAVRLVAGQGGVNQVPVGNPPRPLRNWDAEAPVLQPHFPGGPVVRFTCAWTWPTGGGRSRYYFHHLRRRHQKRPIPPLAPPRRDPGSQQKGIFVFGTGCAGWWMVAQSLQLLCMFKGIIPCFTSEFLHLIVSKHALNALKRL